MAIKALKERLKLEPDRYYPIPPDLAERLTASFQLAGLQHIYSNGRNALAVWHAIDLCARHELELPRWALDYLAVTAATMVTLHPKRRKSDGKNVTDTNAIARALGITAGGGKGNLYSRFENDLRGLNWFIEIQIDSCRDPSKSIVDLAEKYANAEGKPTDYNSNPARKAYYDWRRRFGGEASLKRRFLSDERSVSQKPRGQRGALLRALSPRRGSAK